jgi:hypothetical protein
MARVVDETVERLTLDVPQTVGHSLLAAPPAQPIDHKLRLDQHDIVPVIPEVQ